jgi:hypothetical protein
MAIEVRNFAPQDVVDSNLDGALGTAGIRRTNVGEWRLLENKSLEQLRSVAATEHFVGCFPMSREGNVG